MDEAAAERATGNGVFAGGLKYLTDAQFHSGQYVIGLAQSVARQPMVQLFEGARVRDIVRRGEITEVSVGDQTVRAHLVFLGLNALAPQYVPGLAPSLRAERGQVLITEPVAMRPCSGSFGTDMAWWRDVEEPDGVFRLLFGGGRVREEPDSLFPQFTADGRSNIRLETAGFSPSLAHQHRLIGNLRCYFRSIATSGSRIAGVACNRSRRMVFPRLVCSTKSAVSMERLDSANGATATAMWLRLM